MYDDLKNKIETDIKFTENNRLMFLFITENILTSKIIAHKDLN